VLVPHEAVARDVQLVWDNCRDYLTYQNNLSSPLLANVSVLESLWEEMYLKRILKPIQLSREIDARRISYLSNEGKETISSSSSSSSQCLRSLEPTSGMMEDDDFKLEAPTSGSADYNWEYLVSAMTIKDPCVMPISLLLKLLTWLCTEIVQTDELSSYINSIASARSQTAKVRLPEITSDTQEPNKGSRPSANRRQEDSDDDERLNKNSKLKKKLSTDKDVKQNEVSALPELNGTINVESSSLRWMPLGQDRDGRLYWIFNIVDVLKSDPFINPATAYEGSALGKRITETRLFCEDKVDDTWIIYDQPEDINAILGWLTDKTVCEVQLQASLRNWMIYTGIPITAKIEITSFKKVRKSQSESESEQHTNERKSDRKKTTPQKLVSEDLSFSPTFPTSPVSPRNGDLIKADINQNRIDQDLYSFWGPKELDALACLVEVVFPPDCRQLCVGMHACDNRMVVTGFRTEPNGRSVGKECGFRIGDVILTVNGGLVTSNVDPIKSALQNLLPTETTPININVVANDGVKLEPTILEKSELSDSQNSDSSPIKNETMDQSSTKIDQSSTKIDQSSTKIDQSSTKIDQSSTKIDQSSTKIDQSSTKIDQSSTKIDQSSTKIDLLNPKVAIKATDKKRQYTKRLGKIPEQNSTGDSIVAELEKIYLDKTKGQPRLQFLVLRKSDPLLVSGNVFPPVFHFLYYIIFDMS
jgi:hypothetical protein